VDPFQKRRPILRLLIGRPPLILRTPAILLAAVALYALADPALRPKAIPRSALTLRLVAAAPGGWGPAPVANATGFLEAEVEISGARGPGWSSTSYAPNARIAEPTVAPKAPAKKPDPAKPDEALATPVEKPAEAAPAGSAPPPAPTTTFADIYALWLARLDAGDSTSAKAVGAPLTAAEQREILERLAAREKQRAGDPNWRGFDPLTLDAGDDARLLMTLARLGPVFLSLVAVGLAVARFLYRRQRRALEAAAAAGRCPACPARRWTARR
jgi:hypothetical protein